jgi:hypothetical protein
MVFNGFFATAVPLYAVLTCYLRGTNPDTARYRYCSRFLRTRDCRRMNYAARSE